MGHLGNILEATDGVLIFVVMFLVYWRMVAAQRKADQREGKEG